ncbi:hypothetical protein [Natronorubrum halophilum]|uniref:hypothetical protein n=1 Tax=Natronorubrum halophilum TaxID=1702106 RepID=UPI0010C1ACBE|nr:hypothetical protein [Natronorubrum halophilum]
MATSAGTSADDVRVEINTILDDADIEGEQENPDSTGLLGRVERDIDRKYDDTDITFEDEQHRQDFEATLAALRIAEGLDRRAESVQSGRSSRTYETAEIDNIRQRVRSLDPGDEFGKPSSVIWDSDRHISSSGGNS